jgi:hypothetical protein
VSRGVGRDAGLGVRLYRASDVSEHQNPAILKQLAQTN